jgi:hypothetical protein
VACWTRFRALRSAGRLVIYRSQMMPEGGFGTAGASESLTKRLGPYLEHASTIASRTGLVDLDTVLEDARYQGDWMVRAALTGLHDDGHDLAMFHWHFVDHLNHDHLHQVDPDSPAYQTAGAPAAWDTFAKALGVVDAMVAEALTEVGPDTVVGLVSDHGCVSDQRAVNLRKFLVRQGFLVLRGPAPGLDRDRVEDHEIDWERSAAVLPDDKVFGLRVLAEGADKERVTRALVAALRGWVDPDTGRSPLEVVADRRESQLLGLHGPDVEDVNFAWSSGYAGSSFARWRRIVGDGEIGRPEVHSSHHAGVSPLAGTAMTSNLATLVLAGPGVREGYRRDVQATGVPPITCVAPTLAAVLRAEPPAACESGPLLDLLAGGEGAWTPPRDAVVTQALTYPYAVAVVRDLDPLGMDFSFTDQNGRELDWPVRLVDG